MMHEGPRPQSSNFGSNFNSQWVNYYTLVARALVRRYSHTHVIMFAGVYKLTSFPNGKHACIRCSLVTRWAFGTVKWRQVNAKLIAFIRYLTSAWYQELMSNKLRSKFEITLSSVLIHLDTISDQKISLWCRSSIIMTIIIRQRAYVSATTQWRNRVAI